MTNFRTGIGTDIHRLVECKPLFLGGVMIPSEKGAVAHSDGDTLIHAIIDACLGAAGLGDIGEYFPDTSPKHKGSDSTIFLHEIVELLSKKGYRIVNIDAVIHLEKPKLSEHKNSIRENLAKIIGIPKNCINIKAKTREKLDAVGKNEAIEVIATTLLEIMD